MIGTYTAIGYRWMRVGGSALAHLVPRYPGTLATTVCRRIRVNDLLLETPRVVLSELEKCHACQTRNGTAGPAGDGRVRGMGQ